MLAGCVLLLFIHALFIGFAISGWKRALTHSIGSAGKSNTIDVLVPFRNEEENLSQLFADLHGQHDLSGVNKIYFIDDHSIDRSATNIHLLESDLRIELLHSIEEGKKAALAQGLALCTEPYVLTLDADVRLTESYFHHLNRLDLGDSSMVILPVLPLVKGGFWERFAALDFLSLIGITFSSAAWKRPVMANGANLLRKREAIFLDDSTASGDDVQNLHALKAQGASITWSLNEAVKVSTSMPESFNALFQQRLRWAAKSSIYKDKDTLVLGWYMLLHQVLFILLFLISIWKGDFVSACVLLLLKSGLDFLFLAIVAGHFKLLQLLWVFPMAILVNVLMYPLIFVVSRWGTYSWKDRTYTR